MTEAAAQRDTELRWYQWHSTYDDLESADTDRLAVVQEVLDSALTAAPAGTLTVISVCAGQARDLLPVLINHPRGSDVSALLVEQDPLNASFLHGALGSTDLENVDLLIGDAGDVDVYRNTAPADVVLLGGVFANIDSDDAERTIAALPALCRPGGVVVWSTYGSRLGTADDVVGLLEDGQFQRQHLVRDPRFVVASHRYMGLPQEYPSAQRLFSFR